ncbi:thioredoxin [Candidatus Acetothermia bacterium]|nr:thioredoxin [Candidatus Acetothermia bacterium]
MSKAIQIENNTFEKEVLHSALPTLVDFYADWCGPCKAIAPVIDEIATELAGQLKVAKVNVDESEALSLQYGVQGIPTLILFQNGQEVQRITGFLPKTQLVRQLRPHLGATAAVKN